MKLREQVLKKVADFVYTQYPFIIVLAIFLTILSLAISGIFLTTKTGRIDLISEENPACKRFLNFLEEFGSPDDLVVLIEGASRADRKKAAEALAKALNKEKKLVQRVFYRVPLDYFLDRGLQYAGTETLRQLLDSTRRQESFLKDTYGRWDLTAYYEKLNTGLEESFRQRKPLSGGAAAGLAQLTRMTASLKEWLKDPAYDQLPDLFKKPETDQTKNPVFQSDGYIASKDGQTFFMFVKPSHTKNDFKFIKVFIKSVENLVSEIQKKIPGVSVELTGVPPIIYEEMAVTTKDVSKASVLSFIGITLLFMLCFQAFRKPLMVATVMFMGIAYTFCFATLAVGSLNLMSMVFASMILGSGNDFGVHIIMRYREERLNGHSCHEAVRTVIAHTGQGILSGAAATALVFYTLIFSDFKGFSEFGLISGTGVLICCVSMLIVIPAFLVLWEKSGKGVRYYEKKQMKERHKLTMPHVAKLLRFPKSTIAFSILLTIGFLSASKEVRFNGSLLDIQAAGSKSFANEEKMRAGSPLSPRFGAVLARNVQEAKEKEAALKKLPVVSHVESAVDFLPEQSAEKEKLMEELKRSAEGLYVTWPNGALHTGYLKKTLVRVNRKLALIEKHALKQGAAEEDIKPMLQLKQEIDEVLNVWDGLSSAEAANRLQAFQTAMLASVEKAVFKFREMLNQSPVTLNDLPAEIKERFIGKNGELLLYVFPKESVWGDAQLLRFTEQVKRVDEKATGTPFLVQEVTELMEKGYKKAGWLALAVVILLLFIDFRRVVPTLLALTPLLMGVVWMIGLMGVLGVEFNPANLIAVPLILGIAIDNGVHLVHRFYERRAHKVDDIMKSTTKAVYLNSITTMVCFGSLILASHRGISSLGLVLVLGVLTCLITAITFLPAVLTLMSSQRKSR